MLKRIQLKNFKVAKNIDVPLSSLTLLSGLNGSGKSTVLQSIAALRQSYLFGTGNGLCLNGPLIPLGQGIDVLSEGATEDEISFEFETESGDLLAWKFEFKSDSNILNFLQKPTVAQGFWNENSFQYLQADRIVPRTFYPQADQHIRSSGFLGCHGEYTADFLVRNGSTPTPPKRICEQEKHALQIDESAWAKIAPTKQLIDQISGWLQLISPGARLAVEPISNTDEVLLKFQYIGRSSGLEGRHYRPTHVGFGLTYSLPIIVACLASPPGSLILLENPEAHLHPRGQAKLGELLAICAADGVQIIVESHSDHLLNGIRLAVKQQTIGAEKIKLNYFTRVLASGDCYVETPSVLPNGQLSNWPTGFFDQWETSLDALLS